MYALSIRGLTKTYKNGVQALKGVDLDVEQGDFFALLGPNGAGKTTLIGIVTSLVNKTGGHASACSATTSTASSKRRRPASASCRRKSTSTMFETPQTILVNQAGFYGIERALARERAEKYLKQLQLWDKRNKMARGLSGGMKRRLMIARALMHEPRLLILDEPTAGVDIEIRRSMWDFLREINARGTTIILTTHYLEEAETLCRNIAIIDGGLHRRARSHVAACCASCRRRPSCSTCARPSAPCRSSPGYVIRRSSTITRSRSKCPRSRTSTRSSRA